ncbi:BTB/POZ and TAZ domain-containing protein 4-like [Phoenix dactylifera]|uniref:BTB/POZ and TAZ domain-containing protein 4-like n=1 Tax=Phoenix dactylifera TaxID=42345 RepID=A0A8B8ZFT2_PHODC|nr:BTB/POZ and TAZ domain-containing protein 4-like [Phoenix dactylifera]
MAEREGNNVSKSSPPRAPAFVGLDAIRSRRKGTGEKNCCAAVGSRRDFWDRLFTEGYRADVLVQTNRGIIPAHANVLGMASPVLKSVLNNSKGRRKSISIRGVPHDAVRVFIRYLYTSWQEEMDQFVISLLVLSHCFLITSLKQECVQKMEKGFLTTENVIDVLQLARLCDAPRLCLLCCRFIAKSIDAVSASEGWKVMRKSNPELAKETVKAIKHDELRKKERLKKLEERKIYIQLHRAMEAFIHICRDGCRTIGPIDKVLKGSDAPCNFPACKGLESLVRHFAGCKNRVLGGCSHCKRMWQLLELHASLCDQTDECRVPLCKQLKEKMQYRKKKDDIMWNMLVSKVLEARIFSGAPFL